MKRKTIYLSPPHIGIKELDYVHQVFRSNYLAPGGEMTSLFENEFCKYTGFKYAVAVSSGTSALHLVLRAINVNKGDEVYSSTFTFIGGVAPILYLNANPVFIDSDLTTWNMDPELLESELKKSAKSNSLPKAVITTDIYGQCVNMPRILKLCGDYEVPLICDCAESLGARWEEETPSGKCTHHAGKGSLAAVFSFNGNKIVTTSGGGMIASDQKWIIERVRHLANQAKEPVPYYEHKEIGYNYRLSNVLAAIGRGQLESLDKKITKKRRIFDFYKSCIGTQPGVSFMPEAKYGRSTRWLTSLQVTPEYAGTTSERIRVLLLEKNIESRPTWKPMHLQPVFYKNKKIQSRVVAGSVATELFRNGLCLPSGTALTSKDLDYIIETIQKELNSH